MGGPLYDCGDTDCEECQKAFGPDRSKAIADHEARASYYARLEMEADHSHEEQPLSARDIEKIDAAWEKHKAARRPTEAEFEELKRKRDESMQNVMLEICKEQGWDPKTVTSHVSHSHGCYCACPDGPCQHLWDGPEYVSDDECMMSVTCSLCGAVAAYHDMRCAP